MVNPVGLALVALFASAAVLEVNGAGHFARYFFNVPGGFVQSMGDHKGVSVGYSFPGADGRSSAKVYTAFGHTQGIEGNLPDVFVANQLVNSDFFTLMSSDGQFVNFLDDGSINIDTLKTIIMNNGITLEMIEAQFGRGTRIRVSDFLNFLRSRGVVIEITTQPEIIQTEIIRPPSPPQQIIQVPVVPQQPVISIPAPPPPPPPPRTETFTLRSGERIVIIIDDLSYDVQLVQRVLFSSGLTMESIRSALGSGDITITNLVQFLQSNGYSLVITGSPVSLGNNRYRLQLIDGYYFILYDDQYVNIPKLYEFLLQNRVDSNRLQLILSSGREITGQELVRFLTEQLGLVIDQSFLIVQLDEPLLTWTLTLFDGNKVNIIDDQNIKVRTLQQLIVEKRVTIIMFQSAFPGATGPIPAGDFLNFLQGLPSQGAFQQVQGGGGGSIFIAKFPERTQTVQNIRVIEQPQVTITSNQIQEVDSGEREEIPQPVVVTTARPIVVPTTFRPPQVIQVTRPAGSFVTGGQVRGQVIPTIVNGAYRERPGLQQTVQTFTSQPQIQRFTIQQPTRVRVTSFQRPEIKVNEIVEQVRIPQQQTIRVFQQRPQQVLVQQDGSNELDLGTSIETDQQQGLRTSVIGVRPGSLNLGGNGISTVRFNSPAVSYETHQNTGLVSSSFSTGGSSSFVRDGAVVQQGQSHGQGQFVTIQEQAPVVTLRQETVQSDSSGEDTQQQQVQRFTTFRQVDTPTLVQTRRIVIPGQQRTVVLKRGPARVLTTSTVTQQEVESQPQQQVVSVQSDVRASRGYLARFKARQGARQDDSDEN